MLLKKPESVLVVVYTATGKILCLQRQDSTNFWQSVTGSLLEGESPLAAATRELEEETGLTDPLPQALCYKTRWWFTIYPHWRYRYAPGVTKNLEHVFLCKIAQECSVILSQEHLAYCWLDKKSALKKMSSDTNQRAIELFVEV
ncbi:MAG TPA: dihydroneopterin triphosphate diphosphatase [Gammaproteobacteria bacterium]|nr:dihydroneopterin triphosphate diphosphatase [Gammaproteobacteria bacterium]